MFPVPQQAKIYQGLLFCVLLGAGLWLAAPAIHDLRTDETLVEAWFEGELDAKVEQQLDARSPLRTQALRWWSNVQYLLFKEGMAGVVLGKEGWLYGIDEFRSPPDLPKRIQRHGQHIQQMKEALAAQQIQLLVLLVPTKLDLYPEFSSRSVPASTHSLYQAVRQHLSDQGINVIDTREPLLSAKQQGPVFLSKDTHWSPLGARIAAQAVAQQWPELQSNKPYKTTVKGVRSLAGDLVRYLPFDPALAPDYFVADQISQYQTQPLAKNQVPSASQLFANELPSLQLVGTSYSFLEHLHFPGWLKASLQRDLLVSAIPAKGAHFAMSQFWSEYQLEPIPLTTVIWEFPIRTLLSRGDRLPWKDVSQ